MRHSVLLCRFVGALAALALLLALSAQAGMAMPVPCNSKTAAMVMPDGDAAMPSCDGCGGDDGVGMAMGACIALCGSMLALPLGAIGKASCWGRGCQYGWISV